MSAKTTYSARIIDGPGKGEMIYRRRPNGNLVGELPLGAWPDSNQRSTLNRTDGGDPFERAFFHTPSGRTIEISRDT